ncbi:ABC transporter permease [Homoserinimonas sp. A520]
MVAVFLRLRLAQLANSLRRPPVHLLGLAVLLGYAIAGTMTALGAVDDLRMADTDFAASVIVVCGSLTIFLFLFIPLFFGSDDPADPRACATSGLQPRQIATGLAVSALLSVPALLLAVLAGSQVRAWVEHPDAVVVAVVAAIIIVATGVLGARLTRSIAAFWLHGRRAREIVGLIVTGMLLVVSPGLIAIASTDWSTRDARSRLADVAQALSETPLGAPWAAPALAAGGDSEGAWLLLLYGVAVLLVLWILWQLLVARMLVTPHRPETVIRATGLGWFAVMPGNPLGAIAARSLSYWMRDGRYRLALLVVPVVPILLIVPLLIAGVWWQNLALIPLPVMCLFLGWMIHNDISTDNTALWLHLATETSGWADRIGRTVPPLLLGIPLIAIGAPITARLYGVPDVLPAVFGVSVCLLLAGLGISSVVSARHPYPTVRPGDSPFAQPQSTASSPGQALSFFGTILVTSPVLVLAGLGLGVGEDWNRLALIAGLAIGVGGYTLGVSIGARTFAKRAPELLAFNLRN